MKGQGQSTAKDGKPRGYFPDLRKARPRGWADSVLFICSFSTFGFALHMLVYLLCDKPMFDLLYSKAEDLGWVGQRIVPSGIGIVSLGWGRFFSILFALWALFLSCSLYWQESRSRPEEFAKLSRLGSVHLITIATFAWSAIFDLHAIFALLSTDSDVGYWLLDLIACAVFELPWYIHPVCLLVLSILLLGRKIPDYFRTNGWYVQLCLLICGLVIINLVGLVYLYFLRFP